MKTISLVTDKEIKIGYCLSKISWSFDKKCGGHELQNNISCVNFNLTFVILIFPGENK